MKYLTLFLVMLVGYTSCSQDNHIDQKYVEQVITDLSADELKGRKVFTPEIDRAADYIAQAFESAGLSTLPELSGFKQEFDLFNILVDSSQVIFDGVTISRSDYYLSMDVEQINWTADSEVIVTAIGRDDNFREEMGRIFRNDDDLVVVVHSAHSDMFGRYKRYFGRGSNQLKMNEGRSLVFVLSDEGLPNKFEVNAIAKVEQKQLANVVAMVPGKRTDEFVVFSGHYDHLGIRRAQEGDSIANGANDDASGVAGVIALGKYFSAEPKPERTLLFVAFTAEEVGGYGSQYFSSQVNPDQIVAMFNLEMIGKPSKNGPNTAWITGWDKSDFGEILQNSAEGSIYTFYADPYPSENLFYRSDNATLARKGVPAHSISTTQIDIDEDYHQVTDEVETLDLTHLTNTVKAIAVGATSIVSGEATPARIDPEGL